MRDFNFFCLFLFSTLNIYHLYKKNIINKILLKDIVLGYSLLMKDTI